MNDLTAPDPSPRAVAGRITFSQRCACNAIETGFRILSGGIPSPRQYIDSETGREIWVSQSSSKVPSVDEWVRGPRKPFPSHAPRVSNVVRLFLFVKKIIRSLLDD